MTLIELAIGKRWGWWWWWWSSSSSSRDETQVQQLLDADLSKIRAMDMVGRNVLQYAALSGNLALVAVLASAPYTVPLDSRDNTGQQPIHQAAKGGHVELAKWLVEVGETPVRTVDDHQRTIFHEAALNGRLAFLEWGYAYMLEREVRACVPARDSFFRPSAAARGFRVSSSVAPSHSVVARRAAVCCPTPPSPPPIRTQCILTRAEPSRTNREPSLRLVCGDERL